MKIQIKLVILLGAFLITLIGFNLIASPAAVDLLNRGHHSEAFSIARILSHSQASLHYSMTIKG